ncbi:IS256 family transposase [Nonomuraea sp. NPDC003214]
MARTLPPVQAIRAEIDALFASDRDLVEVIEDVARLGAHLIIQTAVEAEVDAFLGRARYQRATAVTTAGGDEQAPVRPGYRNGHCPTTVKTTSGPITITRPKLRGTTEKFASRLFGTGVTRTHALETLVIASFVRGLSVRDVEGALADALGPEAALSKSTVSTICQAIVAEYDAWCRDLSTVELDYLFCDASHFKMHDGSRAEPILAAWGITTAGKPVFVGLAAAAAESTDAWHDFLTDLVARGLRPPLLIISDGAPGLISAAEQVFPASLRQRCLVHRARNVLAKVSAGDQAEVKAAYWQIFDLSDLGDDVKVGQQLVGWVQRRIDAFADTWGSRYPAAVKCLLTDRQSLTTYLRFPLEHHKRVRHSNFIERTFGETRRRVKVIGRSPGETSCVSLVWAVLDRAARGWRGFTLTSTGLRILRDLRRALLDPPAQLHPADGPALAPVTEAA